MTVRTNWREEAACRDADPDLFFPLGPAGLGLARVQEAKRICRACPVQASCLAWALDQGVGSGVWGGTTEDERRVLRRPAPAASTTVRSELKERRRAVRARYGTSTTRSPAGSGRVQTASTSASGTTCGLTAIVPAPISPARDGSSAT